MVAVLEKSMNNTAISILPVSPDSPYFPLVSGLIGVIIGGIITTYLGYLKTKAMIRWETKFNTYNAILGLKKGEPSTSIESKKRIRLAELLKALSKNQTARGHPNLKDGVCFGPRASG
jgi:hypothetical protein